jgi:hypothetical protein
LAAADWAAAFWGLLRAEFIAEADCDMGCAEAALMVWLVSDRARPLMTDELGLETEGENELLDPAALAVPGDWALLAEAACEAAFWGLLRAAFMPAADWAEACEEEAAAMGVSRMESRISLLISCTAESSPLSEMVSCCSLRPALRLPSMTQFFW